MSENDNKKDNDDQVYDASTSTCYCMACGTRNSKSSRVCQSCGKPLRNVENVSSNNGNSMIVKCPKCRSSQVELVTYQQTSEFSGSKACCGYALCGPLGILFGLDGKKTPAKTTRKCKNCGNEF